MSLVFVAELGEVFFASVELLQLALLLSGDEHLEIELCHLMSEQLEDLALLNGQHVTLSTHEGVREQLYLLHIELGGETQLP